MSDFKTGRQTPPDDDEWPGVWDALDKARKSWVIVGPVHAFISNWKAVVVAFVVIAWISRPEIIGALQVLGGAAP